MHFKARRWFAFALFALPSAASAQMAGPELPRPRLDTVFPCGAKFGTSADVKIAGADLEGTSELLFNNPGIKAQFVAGPDPKEPSNPKENGGAKPGGTFRIAVADSVKPGMYEVRAANRFGVSNPRVFAVGDLAEVLEAEPNNDVPQAQKIALETTVNGTFSRPTDVDYFQFAGRKGQRVLASCRTSSIDSRGRPLVEIYSLSGRRLAGNRNDSGDDALADLVLPADGDYLIRLCEFTYTFGQNVPPLAYFYRLSVTTHPWIDAVFPPMVQPGQKADVTLYGRNLPGGKKSARFAAGRGPHLEELTVSVTAPNEPGTLGTGFRVDPRSAELDGFAFALPGSNEVPIFLADAPVVLEKEPNDAPATAQEIPMNCEVAGRFGKRGDVDWYAFAARKGQAVWIDLYADRLDCAVSGVSCFVQMTVKREGDAADALPNRDDIGETVSPNNFYNRNGDPPGFRFTAPDDGRYLIRVESLDPNSHFGPRANYRLCVGEPKPDFRAVAIAPYTANALPASPLLNRGAISGIEVYIVRKQGFTGPISLTAEGLPPGVECPPQIVGNHQVYALLALAAKPDAPDFTGPIRIVASAIVDGKERRHEARPATVVWAGPQNTPNFPLIARLTAQDVIAVRDSAPFQIRVDPARAVVNRDLKPALPIFLRLGDKLTVPFDIDRRSPEAKAALAIGLATTPRNGQAMPGNQPAFVFNNGQPTLNLPADKDGGSFVLEVRPGAPPGVYPVVVKASGLIPYDRNPDGKNKKPTAFTAFSLPFAVGVLPNSLGRISVSAGPAKRGIPYEVTVRVARENDYGGEFLLKAILPPNAQGVAAGDRLLPAGQDEVKYPLAIAPDAAPATYQNVILEATGLYEHRHPIRSEAKFALQVAK